MDQLEFSGQVLAKVHDNAHNISKAMQNDEISFEPEADDCYDLEELEEKKDEQDSSDSRDLEAQDFMSQVQPIPGYSVQCHAHLLNLVVKKSLKEAELQELLFKVRKIVGHFRSSTSIQQT